MQTFRSIPQDQRNSQLPNLSYISVSKPGQTLILKGRQKGEEETRLHSSADTLLKNQTKQRTVGSNVPVSPLSESGIDTSNFSWLSIPKK